jgi:hypothetical protein
MSDFRIFARRAKRVSEVFRPQIIFSTAGSMIRDAKSFQNPKIAVRRDWRHGFPAARESCEVKDVKRGCKADKEFFHMTFALDKRKSCLVSFLLAG